MRRIVHSRRLVRSRRAVVHEVRPQRQTDALRFVVHEQHARAAPLAHTVRLREVDRRTVDSVGFVSPVHDGVPHVERVHRGDEVGHEVGGDAVREDRLYPRVH